MNRDDFETVVETLENKKGRLSDAQMANATAYQEMEERFGVHRQVIKVVLKLKRMDSSKRGDWLRAFDEYRGHADLDVQGDMVDEDEERAGAITPSEEEAEGMGYQAGMEGRSPPEAIPETVYAKANLTTAWRRGHKMALAKMAEEGGAPFEGGTEGDGEPAPLDLHGDDVPPLPENEPGEIGPESEWAAGQAGPVDNDALDTGGNHYNDGVAAARAGKERADNPNPAKSSAFNLWARGYAKERKAMAKEGVEAAKSRGHDLHAGDDGSAAAVH